MILCENIIFCNEGNILLSCWSYLIWMEITCTSNRFMEQSPLCYFNIFDTKFFSFIMLIISNVYFWFTTFYSVMLIIHGIKHHYYFYLKFSCFSLFALKYTKMTENTPKTRLFNCLSIFHKTETFFIGIIEFLAPKKHMYSHQFCDSNYLRTQVMAQNVFSRFWWRPFWK